MIHDQHTIRRKVVYALFALFLLPGVAFMSGIVSESARYDCVFTLVSTGLKIQRGDTDMQRIAREENERRIGLIKRQADTLAKKVSQALRAYVKNKKVKNAGLGVVDSGYDLYEKGTAGYEAFPTIAVTDSAIENLRGKASYIRMNADPAIVVRFVKVPSAKVLDSLKAVVGNMAEQFISAGE